MEVACAMILAMLSWYLKMSETERPMLAEVITYATVHPLYPLVRPFTKMISRERSTRNIQQKLNTQPHA